MFLLDAGEHQFLARDHLRRVLEVLHHCLVGPDQRVVVVRPPVLVARSRTDLPAEDSGKVRAELVLAVLVDRVAVRAPVDEDLQGDKS